MHRPRTTAALAAIVLATLLTPTAAHPPAAAAGPCGTHRSHTSPPSTIRVHRAATGAVETVDFKTYTKNVLSREWISSWRTESLRAGALAVKSYAWYQVLHWRGFVNAQGECFDVFDSTRDQHYDPSKPTYRSIADAVDATWTTRATKGGRIFATYYNAGSRSAACGANANGWQLSQWGSQACGVAGLTASQIIATYYTGATVTDAPAPVAPPSTPAPQPSPTATPKPTPVLTPAPMPSAPAKPTAAPSTPLTPRPTALPTPRPTLPPPPAASGSVLDPAAAQRPGGGQASLASPPPQPPANPQPTVVTSAGDVPAADRDATARDGAARLADAGDPAFELRPEPDRGGVVSNGAASPTQQWTTVRDAVAAVINALLEGLGVGSVGTAGART